MIRLNLLDESEIPKEADARTADAAQPIRVKTKADKWFTIAPIVLGVFFAGYLGYFLFSVRSPLVTGKAELQEINAALKQVEPKVKKTETLETELVGLRKKTGEFSQYVSNKKNWARVLNVLSDELPDEIVFTRLSVGPDTYKTKVATPEGVVVKTLETDTVSLTLEVPEEFPEKVTEYARKLEGHVAFKGILAGLETAGLVLKDEKYVTTMSIHILRFLTDKDKVSS